MRKKSSQMIPIKSNIERLKRELFRGLIPYRPDYSFIVPRVIDDIDSDLQDYKKLLNVQKKEITEIFSGQSVDGKC